jgi:hypothetical protein
MVFILRMRSDQIAFLDPNRDQKLGAGRERQHQVLDTPLWGIYHLPQCWKAPIVAAGDVSDAS